MSKKEVIMEVKNLKKYFPVGNGKSVKAVDDVSLTLYRGETLGLVGESGCGKSTIAYTLIGMYAATDGEMLYEGQNLTKKKRRSQEQKKKLQIVFQDPGSALNSRRSVGKNIQVPMDIHSKMTREEKVKKTEELLEMVGLPKEFKDKMPRNIGGGERQLASVARALATEPELIILDEPTSALDVSVQAKAIRTLMDLQKKLNLTYLFITHDLSLMRNASDRVAILYLGRLCELAPTHEFFERPMHPYTNMLLSSIPVATEEEEMMKPEKVISEGEIPSPVNAPSGCTFHTRCIDCMEICKQKTPVMKEISPGHFVCCHKYSEEV